MSKFNATAKTVYINTYDIYDYPRSKKFTVRLVDLSLEAEYAKIL
jgi:hypothetical protein